MAKTTDLMGLGMSPLLAARIGDDPVLVTASGAAVGSATQIGGIPSIVFVNASNSGSGIKLPPIGGDINACLLGDDFSIFNFLTATVAIYAANNAAGSAVMMYGNSTSATGTTGVSLISGAQGFFQAITPSVWIFNKTSV